MTPHALGWVPDVPDQRDYTYAVPRRTRVPARFDPRPSYPPVYDQSNLGSCVFNAIGGLVEKDQMRQKEAAPFLPSRLFGYWETRKQEGTLSEDAGASIRDAMKVYASVGAPPEADWPYDITQFRTQPPKKAYADAAQGKILAYQRVPQTLSAMKACLAADNPIVIGFSVYESFESDAVARTGRVPMPKKREKMLGGHAVLIVGYDARTFIVRNSWSSLWGAAGYCYFPHAYLLNDDLADDLWTASVVA